MELRAISGQVNIAQLMSMRSSSGRISIPVSRAQSPYAQFKYIQGVPAASQHKAVPLNRLRVLNSLIDSLVSLKEGNRTPANMSDLSDKAIDAMISQFSEELHNAVTAPAVPYNISGSYATGSLVNLTA